MLRKSIFPRKCHLSSISYARKGEQVPSAPIPVKNISKLQSGLSIATLDQMGPLSSLALVINAGSRHETKNELGVAHFWKNAFIRTVPGSTVVKTIRENELRGDTLYTAVSREHILIASDFLRDDLVDVVPEMFQNLFNNNMEVYEFLDTRAQVSEEAASALNDPATLLVENLHAAAFRNGLGNSLFATEGNTETLKRASLFEFAAKHFTPDRIAIIGKDVNHKDLVTLVEQAFEKFAAANNNATATQVAPTKYFGGERRVDAGNSASSEYILAFPSVSINSPQYTTALVLASLLKTPSGQTFSTSYSDAGLFGVHVSSSNADAVKPAVQSFIDALKSIGTNPITESQLLNAKKSAIIQLESTSSLRHPSTLFETASRLFSTQSVTDVSTVSESILKVNVADLVKLAKQVSVAKPCVSAVGPSSLPYLDEFKF